MNISSLGRMQAMWNTKTLGFSQTGNKAKSKIVHADLILMLILAHACKVKGIKLYPEAVRFMLCEGRAEWVSEWASERQHIRTAVKIQSRAKSTRIEENVKALGMHAMLRWWGQNRPSQRASASRRSSSWTTAWCKRLKVMALEGTELDNRWNKGRRNQPTTWPLKQPMERKWKKQQRKIKTMEVEKSKRRSTNRKSPLFWVYDVYSKKKEKKHTANPN